MKQHLGKGRSAKDIKLPDKVIIPAMFRMMGATNVRQDGAGIIPHGSHVPLRLTADRESLVNHTLFSILNMHCDPGDREGQKGQEGQEDQEGLNQLFDKDMHPAGNDKMKKFIQAKFANKNIFLTTYVSPLAVQYRDEDVINITRDAVERINGYFGDGKACFHYNNLPIQSGFALWQAFNDHKTQNSVSALRDLAEGSGSKDAKSK